MTSKVPIAYFEVKFEGEIETFTIKLIEENKIKHARRILRGEENLKIHINGNIVKKRAIYNPCWSFHLNPESIDFFEMSMEVCDASVKFVEDNLEEIGGATLPDNYWCPWSSQLKREIIFSKASIFEPTEG